MLTAPLFKYKNIRIFTVEFLFIPTMEISWTYTSVQPEVKYTFKPSLISILQFVAYYAPTEPPIMLETSQ